jgi:transcriptional regulator with XRE-family HTH domain
MLFCSILVKASAKPLPKFGRNLARLRSERRLTQEQLAERADVHTRYLQKLEAGVGHPSLIVLCRLKKALGCEWNDLLDKIES